MSADVIDWVQSHTKRIPNKTALKELPSGRHFSYQDLDDRIAKIAGALKERGIKRGDRVAFLMLNSTDIIAFVFASWRLGAICVAVNFRLTPPEIQFVLSDSGTKLLLCGTEFLNAVESMRATKTLKHILHTNGDGSDSPFEAIVAKADPVTEMVEQSFEDQCMLMYSSGTTGKPKGVIITHAMMYFSAAAGVGPAGITERSVALGNMPLFHIAGLNVSVMPYLWMGASSVIAKVFDPEATLDAINSEALEITSIFLVPAAYNAIRVHPKCEGTDFSRLESTYSGAEAVPIPLIEYWKTRGLIIQEGFGMTEACGSSTMLDRNDVGDKVGSVGKPLKHTEIRIVSPEGRDCDVNEQGELWIRGLCITHGYWQRPEANAESFVDGWFRTGDIGRMDEDGYYYIEDRLKDMYISGGENVYPAEIENILYKLDAVAELAVFGVPDKKYGEAGCVVAALKPEHSLDLEEIQSFVADKLARYKHPKHLRIVESLPRNGSGKVLKYKIKESVLPSIK